MAGGRGTRLAPLTEDLPKPMLRVAGRPILERIVLHLVGHGIRRIFLAINYLGDMIGTTSATASASAAASNICARSTRSAPAARCRCCPSGRRAPLLVMNGDLGDAGDVGGLLDFHAAGAPDATVGSADYLHAVPFGCVEVDGDRVARLRRSRRSRLVNAGIYVLAPPAVARIARDTRTTCRD